jgi:hypothetical protein
MAALADETASLSDKDVVDDATADGIDIKAEAARVRGVLLSGLQQVALSQSPTPAHASNTAKRFDDYEKK